MKNKYNQDEVKKFIIFLIIVIGTMCIIHLIINRKKNETINYQDNQIDSIETKISDIDSTIDTIPFVYSDSARTEYFKNYSATR